MAALIINSPARAPRTSAVPRPGPVLAACLAVLVAGLVAGADCAGDALRLAAGLVEHVHQWTDDNPLAAFAILLAAGTLYALALCLPFVPGLELGLVLMALAGSRGALVVYLFTIAGLALAFAAGRNLRGARRGGFRVERLVEAAGKAVRLPAGIARHSLAPYLLTGILVNFPGNSILGGGGGIALLSGYSHGQSWRGFLLTIALATAPLPLLVFLGVLAVPLAAAV